MIIKVADKTTEYNIHTSGARGVIDYISKEVNSMSMALSHIIVDGTEVRNDLIKYIEDNKDSIEVVEGVPTEKIFLPMENAQFIKDTLDSMMPVLEILPKDFRMGVSERGWQEFENMINTILYIDKATKRVFTMFIEAGNGDITASWDSVREEYLKLDKTLKNLQEALDNEDIEAAADLIEFEIKPSIDSTSYMIEKFILTPIRRLYIDKQLH